MITLSTRQLFDSQEKPQKLKCIAGRKGLARKITIPQIQRPGLALTGDPSPLNPGRIQILGNSELRYLKKLPPTRRTRVLQGICEAKIPCMVVTNNNEVPKQLIEQANKYHIPLLVTSLSTATAIVRTQQFLENTLTETTSVHGVLVDVYGTGILLRGKSGIGKSECALELIMRGHRLVADDIVNIRKKRPSTLYGAGSEIIKYHMEIRGLGIINIKDLFGVAAVRDYKIIQLIVELVDWNPQIECERIGIMDKTYEILGVPISFLQIPVRPGRTLSTVIEVAARNQLLKNKGINSAQQFQDFLTHELLTGTISRRFNVFPE